VPRDRLTHVPQICQENISFCFKRPGVEGVSHAERLNLEWLDVRTNRQLSRSSKQQQQSQPEDSCCQSTYSPLTSYVWDAKPQPSTSNAALIRPPTWRLTWQTWDTVTGLSELHDTSLNYTDRQTHTDTHRHSHRAVWTARYISQLHRHTVTGLSQTHTQTDRHTHRVEGYISQLHRQTDRRAI